MTSDVTVADTADWFTAAVLEWGVGRLRDLPWRRTRDPWSILVAEVMLQQTPVGRVAEKWSSFLGSFPTVEDCADAPLADVLRLWQGLGYPRRARNLHLSARRVVEIGGFPDDLAGLLALPGVGQYTARAVLTFAFEADAAVVDTNIARVHARFAGRRQTPKQAQAAADSVCPAGDSWTWNQCLMDLGATVCTARRPDCASCPLRRRCSWAGDPTVADPSVGSGRGAARQAPFAGSDREARGRLMRALSAGPVPVDEVASTMGRDTDTAERLLAGLMTDGLCTCDQGRVALP